VQEEEDANDASENAQVQDPNWAIQNSEHNIVKPQNYETSDLTNLTIAK
jgi:hypothetical protein